MKLSPFRAGAAAASLILLFAVPSRADELSELKAELRALRESVSELRAAVVEQQRTIRELKSPAAPPPVSASAPAVAAAPTGSSKIAPYLPDIGVVADVVASSTETDEDEEGNDRLSVREVELVFGHDVDPYSRLDATITFSDFEDPEVEEAYASYWGLPLELKGRIGRMRQKIGKASATHRDSLETVDEPLVIQRYMGVEGLFRTGVELSGFTPLSGDVLTQQFSGGIMEGGVGEDGLLFGETRRHPSYYARLSNFFELDEVTSFDLGGTYLAGSRDEDQTAEVHAFGADATLIHNIDTIRRVKFLAEGLFQDRNDGTSPAGFYTLADWRFAERWGAGLRYDYVEPIDNPEENPRNDEQAVNAYFTFFQSEFARWRAQYQHIRLAEGENDDRFFLQGTFAIGTHKHNLQ